MITTIYSCDKCHKSQDSSEQMWTIELRVGNLNYGTDYQVAKLQAQWCRQCTELAGLLPPRAVKKEELPPPATLEDLIREIVRQEVQAMQP